MEFRKKFYTLFAGLSKDTLLGSPVKMARNRMNSYTLPDYLKRTPKTQKIM